MHLIRRYPITAFYLLAFTFSWTFLALAYLVFDGNLSLTWVGTFGPAVSSLVITAIVDGKAGVEDLLRRLFHWRTGWRWYAVVILLPLVLFVGSILLKTIFSPDEMEAYPSLLEWFRAFFHALPVLIGLVLLFSIVITGEELGWRGFVQPRLQARWSPFKASLFIGLLWGIWHIPTVVDPAYVLHRAPLYYSIPLFILGTMEFSLVYTWIYNRTGGSLLLMCLFHATYNTVIQFASASYPFIITQFWLYLLVMAVFLIPVIYRDLSPRPHMDLQPQHG